MTASEIEQFNVEVLSEFKDYLKEVRMKQKEITNAEKTQLEDEQLKQLVREGEEE